VGNGLTRDTDSIQQAVDRCDALGGGEVVFPGGTYLSGAVALRSNTTLRLAATAAILGSADFADYRLT
jgi:polygalacturonase